MRSIHGSDGMRLARTLALALPLAIGFANSGAQAQTPNINLMPEMKSKTPEEKEQERIADKAYRESLRKIPDAKTSNDPWGDVRGAETSRPAAKPAPAKTRQTKRQNRTDGAAN